MFPLLPSGYLAFFLPQELQLAKGCSGTMHYSTGRPHIIPWAFHLQQQVFLSWTHPDSAQDAVLHNLCSCLGHQKSHWPVSISWCQVGSETGPRLWCQCWSCGVSSTVSACSCLQGCMIMEHHSIKFCWSQGRREQWNCSASQTHMCALSLQLCRNRTQSPTLVQWLPKHLSEPRHLEHSYAASGSPPTFASATSACENPTQLEHGSCRPVSWLTYFPRLKKALGISEAQERGCHEVEFTWNGSSRRVSSGTAPLAQS